MPLLGDVLQFVFEEILLEQVVRNVFGYVVSVADATTTVEDIADVAIVEIGDVFLQIQNPAVSAVQLSVRNLDNPAEFIEIAWSGVGGNVGGGAVMPSYVASGMKLLRGDTDTRNGSKRFAGMGEDEVTGNAWDNVAGVDVLTLQDALAADITIVPTVMEIQPIIIGRDPITGQPDTGRIAPIIEAVAQANITTQNSRKAGRGE